MNNSPHLGKEITEEELDVYIEDTQEPGEEKPNNKSEATDHRKLKTALDKFNKSRKDPLSPVEVISQIRSVIIRNKLPRGVKKASGQNNNGLTEKIECPEQKCGKMFITPTITLVRGTTKVAVDLILAHQLENHPNSSKISINTRQLLAVLFGNSKSSNGTKTAAEKNRTVSKKVSKNNSPKKKASKKTVAKKKVTRKKVSKKVSPSKKASQKKKTSSKKKTSKKRR